MGSNLTQIIQTIDDIGKSRNLYCNEVPSSFRSPYLDLVGTKNHLTRRSRDENVLPERYPDRCGVLFLSSLHGELNRLPETAPSKTFIRLTFVCALRSTCEHFYELRSKTAPGISMRVDEGRKGRSVLR